MASVFDVAQYILTKQETMTAMKLQKLCYYAQAWSLVWDEAPLFQEDIQAWVNGPVIPDLYAAHQGMYSVTQGSFPQGKADQLPTNQRETIDKIIEFYGQYNPQQLSSLTHQEQPWVTARQGLYPTERGCSPISHASMMEYYSGL